MPNAFKSFHRFPSASLRTGAPFKTLKPEQFEVVAEKVQVVYRRESVPDVPVVPNVSFQKVRYA
jgi:hypothetical protein